MPRGKKNARRKGGDSRPNSEEEYDTADNLSTISNLSDQGSIPEEGPTDEVDETSAQDNFEDQLKEWIDGLSQKSAPGRKKCLLGIQRALSSKYIYDFLMERKVTLADGLNRCLKKGKGEEQVLSSRCFALLCMQLGLEDSEAVFQDVQPVLVTTLTDNSAAYKARCECAVTLAVCTFIVCIDDHEQRTSIMKILENIFKASYRKGDHTIPNLSPDVTSLHASALSAWALLITVSLPSELHGILQRHLPTLPDLLQSQDVDLRIVAGETIALLYELARAEDEDFEGDELNSLCEVLKSLATDSNKYRAKKDRRQQRSSFRDIYKYVEEYEFPSMPHVRFGTESLYIDSWMRKKHFDVFCHVLGSGINQQLQENDFVRDVFELGSPIPVGVPVQKVSKIERTLYNAAMFKARTKARSKHRDKRAVTVNMM